MTDFDIDDGGAHSLPPGECRSIRVKGGTPGCPIISPSPYPSTSSNSISPDPGTGAIISHEVKHSYVVRTEYDIAYSSDDDLILLTVEVWWKEGAGGGTGDKKVTLTTEVSRK